MRAAEIITETGGFRVGWNSLLALNATWPFGSFEIDRDRLVLRALFRRYSFVRDSIVSLSTFSGFFARGLRIEHSISTYPRFIVFWPAHMERLRHRLQDAGYAVDDTGT